MDKLNRLKSEIRSLRRARYRERVKPHKPLMLLVVLDLLETGEVAENRFAFDDILTDRFRKLFELACQDGDWCHPSEPFFHLRTSGFWFHKPRPGREKACAELDTSGGGSKRILDNIEYAFLDPESFSVVNDATGRAEVRSFILETFFSEVERKRLAQALALPSRGW